MFCTYCIIPYARGPIKSRPLDDIYKEAKKLSENGYKEIIITGIHVGSYGLDLDENISLIDVIEKISTIEKIDRIRLSSIEAGIISYNFLQRLKNCKKVCEHFHLSLQSGCDKILKLMNRRYTTKMYKQKVSMIREIFPNVALTTDIIVGFPEETDEDFNETLEFVKDIGFSKIHVFKYSKRKGTPAASMKNQVDGNIKIERSEKLLETNDRLMEEFIEKNKNRSLKVLFEERKGDYYEGYTTNYIRCKLKTQEELKNKIINVKIKGVEKEEAEVEKED